MGRASRHRGHSHFAVREATKYWGNVVIISIGFSLFDLLYIFLFFLMRDLEQVLASNSADTFGYQSPFAAYPKKRYTGSPLLARCWDKCPEPQERIKLN